MDTERTWATPHCQSSDVGTLVTYIWTLMALLTLELECFLKHARDFPALFSRVLNDSTEPAVAEAPKTENRQKRSRGPLWS